MIRELTGVFALGFMIVLIARGGGDAVPTPITESLESAPSWATQENLLGSGRIRDHVIELKDGRRLEISFWNQRPNTKAVTIHFKNRARTDPILSHIVVRNGDAVFTKPEYAIVREFPPPVWLLLTHDDTVVDIYR
jgi:hypothetical protein